MAFMCAFQFIRCTVFGRGGQGAAQAGAPGVRGQRGSAHGQEPGTPFPSFCPTLNPGENIGESTSVT